MLRFKTAPSGNFSIHVRKLLTTESILSLIKSFLKITLHAFHNPSDHFHAFKSLYWFNNNIILHTYVDIITTWLLQCPHMYAVFVSEGIIKCF